ncbi:GNAT family N-acetyltransferase [Microbacterium sp.]|uniref:GNAT family N-acetyltransferase n=1 Tax=Microbacterium sp. TaxID=51671 RepID=UPI003C7358DA
MTTMTELVIRKATEIDFDAVGEVTHDAYAHDYDDLSDEYRENLRHPERLVAEYQTWVAERDGRLVGVISIRHAELHEPGWIEPDELYFRLLAVSPAARGTGIGQALIEHAFDVARERGAVSVVMNSGPQMKGAHALYRKLGFIEPADRQRFVDDGGVRIRLHTFSRYVAPAPVSRANAG